MQDVLGVDFGRVINDGSSHPSGDDTAFLTGSEEIMLATPAMPGAMEGLASLVGAFDGRVWIISKAGPRIPANTERWLAHHELFSRTGVRSEHLCFVRRRVDKVERCRALAVTHFIDDRAEVIRLLEPVVRHRFLFGPQRDAAPRGAVSVLTWAETVPAVLATRGDTPEP